MFGPYQVVCCSFQRIILQNGVSSICYCRLAFRDLVSFLVIAHRLSRGSKKSIMKFCCRKPVLAVSLAIRPEIDDEMTVRRQKYK
jgi:hypothetical protein